MKEKYYNCKGRRDARVKGDYETRIVYEQRMSHAILIIKVILSKTSKERESCHTNLTHPSIQGSKPAPATGGSERTLAWNP